MKSVRWILFFLLTFAPAARAADTHEAVRVDFTVICDDPLVQAKLAALIDGELKKDPEMIRDEKVPQRKLFLYAQKDINDRKNPNGWSFSIAHVSNVVNRILASRLDECQDVHCVDARRLTTMTAKEEGFLKHLNVAHVDELTDATMQQLVSAVFSSFAQKVKGQ